MRASGGGGQRHHPKAETAGRRDARVSAAATQAGAGCSPSPVPRGRRLGRVDVLGVTLESIRIFGAPRRREGKRA
jgi:hypothetical protein